MSRRETASRAEIDEALKDVAAKEGEKKESTPETGRDEEKIKQTLAILTTSFDNWRSLRSLLEDASSEINFKDLVRTGFPPSRRPQDQEAAILEEAANLRVKVQEAADELAKKINQLLSYSSITPHLKESMPDLQVETPEDIETILEQLVKPVISALRDEFYRQSHITPKAAKSAHEELEEAAWQASGQGAALTEEQATTKTERRFNFERLVKSLKYLPGVHNNPEAEAVNTAYASLLQGKGYNGKDIATLLAALQFYVATETDKEMAERVGRLEYNYTTEDLTNLKRQIKEAGTINVDSLASLPKEAKGVKKAPAEKKPLVERPERKGGLISLKEARAIMGTDLIGIEEIKQSLGVELKNVPAIPFTKQELTKAKADGFRLVLRVDKDAQGQPLTAKRLNEIYTPKFDASAKGKVLYDTNWYQNEAFFTAQPPRLGWTLQQKEFLPNSAGKNYLEQTQLILDYLRNQKFTDPAKEKKRQEAIAEADRLLPGIEALDIIQNWQEVAQRLADLKINTYRRSPAEVIYDHAVSLDVANTRLFEGQALYEWTQSRSSNGYLVRVGDGDARGLNVRNWNPGNRADDVGVAPSV